MNDSGCTAVPVTMEEEKDDEEESVQILLTRKICSRLSAANRPGEFCISFCTEDVFSHPAAKGYHQSASQQDICTAEEGDTFHSVKESVLCSLGLQHPLVCDIYIYNARGIYKLKKLSVNTLHEICAPCLKMQ